MKSLNQGESSIPYLIEHIDWVAFQHLQEKRSRTRSNFNLQALEFAQDKALEPISRKASGQKLAEDLFRDGKRKAYQPHDPQSRVSKATMEYFRLKEEDTDPLRGFEDNFKLAVEVVKRAFASLGSRCMAALYLKVNGSDSETSIKKLLGVGIRQYRNILAEARAQLRSYRGFEEAYFLMLIHAEENDLMDFLSRIIQQTLQNIDDYTISHGQ